MELTTHQQNVLENLVEYYPDFPQPGILFKDVSLIYTSKEAMIIIKSLIIKNLAPLNPDCVIGCDARGFIIGTLVADTLGIPLVLARKPGKLPGDLISKKYELEYGFAELQMHRHIITRYKSPIICDDLLATGGTVNAISEILEELGILTNSYFFISEITEVGARERLKKYNAPVFSLLK